jgi:hypothetical protein
MPLNVRWSVGERGQQRRTELPPKSSQHYRYLDIYLEIKTYAVRDAVVKPPMRKPICGVSGRACGANVTDALCMFIRGITRRRFTDRTRHWRGWRSLPPACTFWDSSYFGAGPWLRHLNRLALQCNLREITEERIHDWYACAKYDRSAS